MLEFNFIHTIGIVSNMHLSKVFAGLLLVLISGCVVVTDKAEKNQTQLAISSVWDIPTSFPTGSTFLLSPKYIDDASLNAQQQKNIYQLYANAISMSLEERGFIETPENADFHVGFAVALANDLNDKTIEERFGVTPGLHESNELEKGSFLIYVENADTRQRVWRGTAQGFIQEGYSKVERKARTFKVVNMLLSQFYTAG